MQRRGVGQQIGLNSVALMLTGLGECAADQDHLHIAGNKVDVVALLLLQFDEVLLEVVFRSTLLGYHKRGQLQKRIIFKDNGAPQASNSFRKFL